MTRINKYLAFAILLFEISSTAHALDGAAVCVGNDWTKWNNCIGEAYDPSNKNGKKYKGIFINGSPNGKGEITFNKSSDPKIVGELKYVGDVKDWKYDGYGVMVYPTTRDFSRPGKYSGNWKDGRKYGLGLMEYPNGNSERCFWDGNECVRKSSESEGLGSFASCSDECANMKNFEQCVIKESITGACKEKVNACIKSCSAKYGR